MPNIISSAIVNAPPPDLMADVLNRRNKIHHFDKQTDEAMIPIFQHGVDGKPRNNKHLLPHRNWCSIRQWVPGNTPPPTPPESPGQSPPPSQPSEQGRGGGGGVGGLLRRISGRRNDDDRPNLSRDSVRGPNPPVTRGRSLFRRLSSRLSSGSRKGEARKLTRSMSVDQVVQQAPTEKRGFFGLGRRGSRSRPDDGGINGQWGDDDDEPYYYQDPQSFGRVEPSGIRGGLGNDEYSDDDEAQFTARPPQKSHTIGPEQASPAIDAANPPIRPFHRTPTGLSTKQLKKPDHFAVDLEGGLDICLNVEVNPKDPAGITMPYRILVPKLFYEYSPVDDLPSEEEDEEPKGFRRFLSIRKKAPVPAPKPSTPMSQGQFEGDDYSMNIPRTRTGTGMTSN